MHAMNDPSKVLIVDDDPDAAAWLECVLQQQFPDLEIVSRSRPDLSGAFDIYFIDNDFDGQSLAGDLATAIRSVNPDALIVAFSGKFDHRTLKQLVNSGCDGACEKSDLLDIEQMLRTVSAYLEQQQNPTPNRHAGGLFGAIHSIRNLLAEWNRRLVLSQTKPVPVDSNCSCANSSS